MICYFTLWISYFIGCKLYFILIDLKEKLYFIQKGQIRVMMFLKNQLS